MKNLFICDTPMQFVNILNFVISEVSNDNNILLIINQFKGAKDIYLYASNNKWFAKVYMCEEKNYKYNWLRHMSVFLNMAFPKKYLLKSNVAYGDLYNYNFIMAGVNSHQVTAFLQLNKSAQFWLIEDGMGSYFGDIVTDGIDSKYRFISKIVSQGCSLKTAEYLYLNNVNLCKSKSAKNKKSLRKWDKDFLDELERIFGRCSEHSAKIYYLSQPLFSIQGYDSVLSKILIVLQKYNVILRVHPRDDEKLYNDYFKSIDNTGIWELKAQNESMNESLIISYFSTAQVTPKILFDNEPYIIFLYKLFGTMDSVAFNKYESVVKSLRKEYKRGERIMCPENINEFEECIEIYCQEVKHEQ